ncbi:MAG: hypothetical protein FWG33_02765 [Oscillospiraceae bacterium]|nr:hypothetical protein [Oscillospiraceae bacterium]
MKALFTKPYVINNVIALAIHILLTIVVDIILWILTELSLNALIEIVITMVMTIVLSLVYVVCGFFFLPPVEEHSYLSVVLVSGILKLICFVCLVGIFLFGIESMFPYMISNPIYATLCLFVFGIPGGVVISPIFPSLFMFIGIVLRKRLKIKNNLRNSET